MRRNSSPINRAERELRRYWRRGGRDAKRLRHLARGFLRQGDDASQAAHDLILTNLATEHLTELLIRRPQRRIPVGCSFRAIMTWQYELSKAVREHDAHHPGGTLPHKDFGRRFSLELGLPIAEVIQEDACLDEVLFLPGTAIKPSRGSGSRGVLLVHDLDRIVEVATGTRHRSPMAALASVRANPRISEQARWVVETLLRSPNGGAPNDLKFYSFYGQVALVLEVTRGRTIRYAWFNRDGQPVDVGKYAGKGFDGYGVTSEAVRTVELASSKIPVPFMRIDGFWTDRGLVFGEYTARPGAFEQFDLPTDRWLGEHWVHAEARLYADLRRGRRFSEYDAAVKATRRRRRAQRRSRSQPRHEVPSHDEGSSDRSPTPPPAVPNPPPDA